MKASLRALLHLRQRLVCTKARTHGLDHCGLCAPDCDCCHSMYPLLAHALQLMHSCLGSSCFSFSMARCSTDLLEAASLTRFMLSTSTVNLIASAAAFVRK
eukprot:TRINITY_DN256_c1_g3_i1.p2 TRINITY_DN256_c1_g3~~TRINITY_DN256_c1_g3_i1.p2  ORF type:complete len:101 (+),score=10.30 TRINITY_DN256_c1_g3_i1:176-478(+)